MKTLKFMDKTVDYPSWQKLLLSEVADWYNGYAFKPSDLSNNGTPVIKIKEILDDTNLDVKTQISDIPENNRISHGDLILSWSMTIATKIWSQQDAYLNQHLYKVEPKDVTFEYFLKYALDSIKSEIKLKMHGGIAKHITRKDLLNLTVSLPSLPEQEKIAGFLGALDERIRAQEEIIEKLKDQKQGYLQKIFNQELRFRDEQGGQYPKWETRKLSELMGINGSGGTPKSSNSNFYNGHIPFLSVSDITKQGKYLSYTEKSITQDGLDNSGAWIVPKDSLIYAMYASVGKMCISQKEVSTSQALYAIQPNEKVKLSYLYSALERYNQKYLEKYITQGTQRNINASTLKSFEIPVPSISEQEKIANLFESFDARFILQEQILDSLKLEKQSYMQKMF